MHALGMIHEEQVKQTGHGHNKSCSFTVYVTNETDEKVTKGKETRDRFKGSLAWLCHSCQKRGL